MPDPNLPFWNKITQFAALAFMALVAGLAKVAKSVQYDGQWPAFGYSLAQLVISTFSGLMGIMSVWSATENMMLIGAVAGACGWTGAAGLDFISQIVKGSKE